MFKLAKTLHFIGITMFLGSIMGYIAMGIVLGSAADVQLVHHQRQIIRGMTWGLTVPGMWLVVLSGVVMTVVRRYGWFRIRWLSIKQALAVIILVNGSFVLAPLVERLVALSADGVAAGMLPEGFLALEARENMLGGLNVLLILTSLVLGVFKPLGKRRASAPEMGGSQ